jgi:hypothetical protein
MSYGTGRILGSFLGGSSADYRPNTESGAILLGPLVARNADLVLPHPGQVVIGLEADPHFGDGPSETARYRSEPRTRKTLAASDDALPLIC